MRLSQPFDLPGFSLDRFVRATLAEDLFVDGVWPAEVDPVALSGDAPIAGGDVTARATIPEEARFTGTLNAREAMTLAGLPIAAAFFSWLDPEARIDMPARDGDRVERGAVLMRIEGKARAMLTAERSALNMLQHLSGIATLTARYVAAIAGTGATLLDTRKTLPGLRVLEKYATRMGGATNHRLGLWDAAMIKDNHIGVAGSVEAATRHAREAGLTRIIVEVDREEQIEPAIAGGATHLLLDNMTTDQLRACVQRVAGRVPTEASGGVNLETIRAIAETGVSYISVGRITQSAPAVDIGLDFALV